MNKSQLLLIAAEAVDLSLSNRSRAESAYPYIGDWLARPESPLTRWDPDVYPQGSMRLGTANNPYGEVEFDVDAVIELALSPDVSNTSARNSVLQRLNAHASLGKRIEVLDKCFRLHYADGFHVDVITAKPGGSEILIATATTWLESAPKAFARWFDDVSARVIAEKAVMAGVEPLPAPVSVPAKPRLKTAVQLMKRRRDVHYDNDPSAPASMLITAVAGYAYLGDQDALTVLQSVTAGLRGLSDPDHVPNVPNPVNLSENLARGLADRQARQDLGEFVRETAELLAQFRDAVGLDEIYAALTALFGSGPASVALTVADIVTPQRNSGSLRFSPTAGLGATGALVRPHSFHGS